MHFRPMKLLKIFDHFTEGIPLEPVLGEKLGRNLRRFAEKSAKIGHVTSKIFWGAK